MSSGGRSDAQAVFQRLLDRLYTVGGHGFATALLGRATQAGQDSVANHGPLELGENTQHAEHGPAGWGAGVEALLMKVQVNILGLDVAEEAHQMRQRPS